MPATSTMVCHAGAIAGGVAGAGGGSFIGGLVESFSGAGKEFLFDRIAELEAGESETAQVADRQLAGMRELRIGERMKWMEMVELSGIEPLASSLRTRRSPS